MGEQGRSSGYAELRAKSAFTFLRGASRPAELIERATELGLAGLGLTDENTLAGVVRAHIAAKERGLRLLPGAELVLRDGARLVVHVRDRAGYGQLARCLTVGRMRAPKGQCSLDWEEVEEFSADWLVIAIPTGSTPERARRFGKRSLGELRDLLDDRLYLAAERHLGALDEDWLGQLRRESERAGVPLVATNDVLLHEPGRRRVEALFGSLRERTPLATLGRRGPVNAEHILKSGAAMRALLDELAPGAVERTLEFVARCDFSLAELNYESPREVCHDGWTAIETLRDEVEKGVSRRFPEGIPTDLREILEHELELIEELGYESYFLTVHDLVRFARERKILCQGRGSAANSAVCFCLGITEVDPTRHELLFERFVSAERGEPPDIDVDFEHERREEVIQYVYRRYGRLRTGMTATVIRFRSRSSLRETARAFGLSEDAAGRLVKGASGWRSEAPDVEGLVREGFDPESPTIRAILELSQEIQGFPRHLSQHVGGLVITRRRLDELVPIENAAMEDRTVIQWDKDDLDELGLLKIDLLSLGMLSALHRAFLLVDRPVRAGERTLRELARRDPKAALTAVLAEDPGGLGQRPQAKAVYAMLQEADSVGTFQVESRAQRAMLPRLKPTCFYDLVIEIALVRPGPIQGGMVNPYLKRREGEPWDYPHPCTEPVLKRTLGVPLFQEQVMRLAVVAAGFTPAEADGLRRAMGAWRKTGAMNRYRDKLMEGLRERGIAQEFAEQIYSQIEGFAEYGFPESHAASFAILCYVSSWLKRFHPAAFTAALLNSQPMGFYTPDQLVRDARAHGVIFRPVDVQWSGWESRLEPVAGPEDPATREQRAAADFAASFDEPDTTGDEPPPLCAPTEAGLTLERARRGKGGPAVRLGLMQIRGLGQDAGQRIAEAREAGPFLSPSDLRRRARLKRREMSLLAAADALSGLGCERREALWEALGEDDRPLPLFENVEDERRARPDLPRPDECDQILADYRSLGLSLRRHPMALIREALNDVGLASSRELEEAADGTRIRIAGLAVVRQRPPTAKGVLFLTLEDEFGSAGLVVPPRVTRRHRHIARTAVLIVATGVVERVGSVVHLLVRRLEGPPEGLPAFPVKSRSFR